MVVEVVARVEGIAVFTCPLREVRVIKNDSGIESSAWKAASSAVLRRNGSPVQRGSSRMRLHPMVCECMAFQ